MAALPPVVLPDPEGSCLLLVLIHGLVHTLISQLFHPLCNQLLEFNSCCLKYLEELLSFCFLTSKSLPPWSKATTVCHSDNGLPAIVFVYQYNSQRMLLKSKLDSCHSLLRLQ